MFCGDNDVPPREELIRKKKIWLQQNILCRIITWIDELYYRLLQVKENNVSESKKQKSNTDLSENTNSKYDTASHDKSSVNIHYLVILIRCRF